MNLELCLQELTLLVGRNGAGKTAVLDVVYALRRLLEGTSRVTDRDIFPPSSPTRWQERPIQSIQVDLELSSLTLAEERSANGEMDRWPNGPVVNVDELDALQDIWADMNERRESGIVQPARADGTAWNSGDCSRRVLWRGS